LSTAAASILARVAISLMDKSGREAMLHMLMRRPLKTVGAVCVALALGAMTETAAAEDNAIVVTGRTPESAQRFIEQLSTAPATADQLARWDHSICTAIAGLPQRQGEFIADRIAQRANAVGLTPGAPGCVPNVSVIVTADSDALAQRMYAQNRDVFAYQQATNITTLGQAELDDFLHTPRPVRWWHVSERLSADGMALSGDSSQGGMMNAPAVRSSGSRLQADTREDLNRAIIIVDARRVGSVQLAALADYISMVALAQINPNAQVSGYPSILSLFASRRASEAAPTAMTDWDTAYLDGLYHSTRNAHSVRQQQAEIAQRMLASR
jgi:hypothetical protein